MKISLSTDRYWRCLPCYPCLHDVRNCCHVWCRWQLSANTSNTDKYVLINTTNHSLRIYDQLFHQDLSIFISSITWSSFPAIQTYSYGCSFGHIHGAARCLLVHRKAQTRRTWSLISLVFSAFFSLVAQSWASFNPRSVHSRTKNFKPTIQTEWTSY